jgi:hypothetical protein
VIPAGSSSESSARSPGPTIASRANKAPRSRERKRLVRIWRRIATGQCLSIPRIRMPIAHGSCPKSSRSAAWGVLTRSLLIHPTRWTLPANAIAAAVCGGIGLAIWAGELYSHPPSFVSRRTLPLSGAEGTVVRLSDGEATMVISGLHAAPNGKTYEAWVMQNGTAVLPGLFRALGETTVVHFTRRVSQGARVVVTIETASGATRSDHRPLFSSARA